MACRSATGVQTGAVWLAVAQKWGKREPLGLPWCYGGPNRSRLGCRSATAGQMGGGGVARAQMRVKREPLGAPWRYGGSNGSGWEHNLCGSCWN